MNLVFRNNQRKLKPVRELPNDMHIHTNKREEVCLLERDNANGKKIGILEVVA